MCITWVGLKTIMLNEKSYKNRFYTELIYLYNILKITNL